jgi:hypothetical protein
LAIGVCEHRSCLVSGLRLARVEAAEAGLEADDRLAGLAAVAVAEARLCGQGFAGVRKIGFSLRIKLQHYTLIQLGVSTGRPGAAKAHTYGPKFTPRGELLLKKARL